MHEICTLFSVPLCCTWHWKIKIMPADFTFELFICIEHKCFKCWWLALPEKKTITKPLINSTFNHGLHEGSSYTVLTIIKELLRQFES